ncbi:TPA: hypothetical protein ACSP8B_003858 [Aeromonas veronii]
MLELHEIEKIYNEEIDKDLLMINSWIEDIENNLSVLNNKKEENNNLNLVDRYEKLKYEYYLSKAFACRDEVERYKGNANLNCEYIFRRQSFKPLNKMAGYVVGSIYSFDCFPYRMWIYDGCCNPKSSMAYVVRFGHLSSSVSDELYEELIKSYKNRAESDEYYEFCEGYIEEILMPIIKDNIDGNYFLSVVKNDLNHVLEKYEQKDYRSIAHILPPLIEGLIHDICYSLGLKSVEYDKVSFNESIKFMADKVGKSYTYEYFLFEFPIVRNKIAHGRKSDLNMREVALHFILDISALIELAKNNKIPINIVSEIASKPTLENLKLIKDVEYEILPEVIKEKYSEIGVHFAKDDFWVKLKESIGQKELDDNRNERFCKFILSNSERFKLGSEVKKQCLTFLKETLPCIKAKLLKDKEKSNKLIEMIRESMGKL